MVMIVTVIMVLMVIEMLVVCDGGNSVSEYKAVVATRTLII